MRGLQADARPADAQLPAAGGFPDRPRRTARVVRQEDRGRGDAGEDRRLRHRSGAGGAGGRRQGAFGPVDGRQTVLLPQGPDLQGRAHALRRRAGRKDRGAHQIRAEHDRVDGISGLLPDRVGLYPRRTRNGRVGGTRPWLGRLK